MLKILVLLLFALAIPRSWLFAKVGQHSKSIPVYLEHYLKLDREFNTFDRMTYDNGKPDASFLEVRKWQGKWQPYYELEFDKEDPFQSVGWYSLKELSAPFHNKLRFFADPRTINAEITIPTIYYAELQEKCCVTRISGQTSYLFYPSDEKNDLFAIKTAGYNVEYPIPISEYYALVAKKAKDPLLPYFLHESSKIEGRINKKSYQLDFISRDLRGLKKAHRDGKVLLPLQGFLGAVDQRQDFKILGIDLSRRKSTGAFILQELAEPFARWQATLHYRYGLFHESHAQNTLLLASVEEESIDGFVLKDFGGSFIDEIIMRKNGFEPEFCLAKVRNHHWLEDSDRNVSEKVGYIIADKVGQATVLGHNQEFIDASPRIAIKFVEIYEEEVKKITGYKTLYSAKFKRLLEAYKSYISKNKFDETKKLFEEYLKKNGYNPNELLYKESYSLALNLLYFAGKDLYTSYLRKISAQFYLPFIRGMSSTRFKQFMDEINNPKIAKFLAKLNDENLRIYLDFEDLRTKQIFVDSLGNPELVERINRVVPN